MTTLEQALRFTDPSGHQISGILTNPTGGTDRLAVLCHGFLSNKNSATNRALTGMLLPQGIATLRFDFFGHGDSEGPFEKLTVGIAVQQTLAALGLAGSHGYRKISLVGSSFGGLVAILATGQLDTEAAGAFGLTCLALKCPVSDLAAMLREEFGTTEMRQWQRTNTIPNITGGPGRIPLLFSFYEDCAHHVAYEAPQAMTLPTLIVHGNADECVPVAQSLRLQKFLGGNTSLVVLAGADHHFSQPGHFREMTGHIGRWIVDRLN
jgi:uncharacterized protein